MPCPRLTRSGLAAPDAVRLLLIKVGWRGRSLAKRQAPEYAPWLVASGYLIDIFRYLQLHRPDPGCADRWAAFVRANVTTEFLASNSELQLNATLADSADAAQSDVQARLLRPLLLGLAAEFNDTGVREQAVALFSVGFCRLHSGLRILLALRKMSWRCARWKTHIATEALRHLRGTKAAISRLFAEEVQSQALTNRQCPTQLHPCQQRRQILALRSCADCAGHQLAGLETGRGHPRQRVQDRG